MDDVMTSWLHRGYMHQRFMHLIFMHRGGQGGFDQICMGHAVWMPQTRRRKSSRPEGRPTRSWGPEGPSSKTKRIALRCWYKSWWLTNKLLEECSFKFDICKLVQIQIGILLDRKNFDQFQPVFNRWKLSLNLALGVEGAEFSPALVAPYMSLTPSCTCH